MSTDPTRFRVTLICTCMADYAEGYGATVEEADATALRFFRQHHGRRAHWAERVVDHAVEHGAGGSHYEEVTS